MKDALGSVQSVLLLGGTSDIGLATVRKLVTGRTRTVVLAARDAGRLTGQAEALRAGGAAVVDLVDWDADEVANSLTVLERVFDTHPDLDLAIVAVGVLGDQQAAERAPATAAAVLHTNFVAAAAAALAVANRMRAQGHGTIVVLSSVAGERVRAQNFVYGSSKAGLDGFSQGLADSLAGTGVSVTVVRPGFVRTKMTAQMDPGPMASTAEQVADAIVAGVRAGAHTVWAPGKLRFVMSGLRHVPRPVFRRLKA